MLTYPCTSVLTYIVTPYTSMLTYFAAPSMLTYHSTSTR
jgi:hypothetical protein